MTPVVVRKSFCLTALCMIVTLPWLVSCNTVGTGKSWLGAGQLTTSDFLFPNAQLDSTGQWLPYRATTNPYDLQPAPHVSEQTRTDFNNALKLKRQGQLDKAGQLLQSLTKTQPQLSGPWLQLADIGASQGDWESAEANYRQAVSANEWNIDAWVGLGISQRQLGRMDDARESYSNALRHWPDSIQAHKNLAILFDIYLNDAISAQPHYEALVVLSNADNQEYNDWLTEVRRRTGKEHLMPVSPSSDQPAATESEG